MKRGEIWLVQLDETAGHEQQGLRPAIILTDTPTSLALVVPLTANLKALRFHYTIQIEPTKRNGLNVDSVALVFHLRSIDKRRLIKAIGVTEKPALQKIMGMIKQLFQ
ncbi:MAG: type II toxin-antitoxin system PemK/MazF family toxin [Candidatus Vogelbacteria bacterium]|nr:type II toxin-antitoxin system PemK/MazF family toxin [Candidatus Vogelbacteria bacterium]